MIKGLAAGHYSIGFLQPYREVKIKVVKGEPWEGTNKIYNRKTNTLYNLPDNSNNSISLGEATIREEDEVVQV